jgi:hypothetical protein
MGKDGCRLPFGCGRGRLRIYFREAERSPTRLSLRPATARLLLRRPSTRLLAAHEPHGIVDAGREGDQPISQRPVVDEAAWDSARGRPAKRESRGMLLRPRTTKSNKSRKHAISHAGATLCGREPMTWKFGNATEFIKVGPRRGKQRNTTLAGKQLRLHPTSDESVRQRLADCLISVCGTFACIYDNRAQTVASAQVLSQEQDGR